jgi:hypothetical protein
VGIDHPADGDTPDDDAPARRADGDVPPLLDPFARMAEQAWYRGTVESSTRRPATPGLERSPACAPPGRSTKRNIPNGPGWLPAPSPTALGWPAEAVS